MDLWVDYLRTDGQGLTHTSVSNARLGVSIRVGDHVIVGNEEADPAVARVASVDDDGVVVVAVLLAGSRPVGRCFVIRGELRQNWLPTPERCNVGRQQRVAVGGGPSRSGRAVPR